MIRLSTASVQRARRALSLILLSGAMLSTVADVRAAQPLKVTFGGSDVYCLFDPSCQVTSSVLATAFLLPNTNGSGILSTRTFAASPGSDAAGWWGYEYRIDLRGTDATTGLTCIDNLRVKLGTPLSALDYDGDGTTGDQVYQLALDFIGDNTIVTSAEQDGVYVTFHFGVPVCAGAPVGDVSTVIGVLASGPPIDVVADLETESGDVIHVGARGPNLALSASYKLTLLYDNVVALPPGGFIAPTMNAAEGRRQAMLNRIAAASRLVENGRNLPAVQLVERLASLADGGPDDWVQDDPSTPMDERIHLLQMIQEAKQALDDCRLEGCR